MSSDRAARAGSQRKRPRTARRASRFSSPSFTIKAFVAGAAAVVLGLILWIRDSPGHYTRTIDWDDRREQVKEAFITSWDSYAKYAWGS